MVGRRGRINAAGDLRQLAVDDLFGDRTGRLVPHAYAKNGFGRPATYYRSWIERMAFANQGRVVDLAAGFGRWGVFLAEVNDAVTFLDIDPYLLDIAGKLAGYFGLDNIDTVAGSVDELPFADGAFDSAWLFSVLFYVDRHRALTEVGRILKPGGRCFMGSFNGPGKMIQKMCLGYQQGGLDHWLCREGIAGLRGGPFANGPPNYGTDALLGEILAPFDLVVERCYPVERYRVGTLGEADRDLVADLPALADRFVEDEAFRPGLVARYEDLIQAIDFDLWFSARKRVPRPPGSRAKIEAAQDPVADHPVLEALHQSTGGQRVLDLECGRGDWSFRLAERNRRVVGLDPDAGAIAAAYRCSLELDISHIDFLVGDLSRVAEFPDGHFDQAWAVHGLPEGDRNSLFPDLFRVLRPGGRLFLSGFSDREPTLYDAALAHLGFVLISAAPSAPAGRGRAPDTEAEAEPSAPLAGVWIIAEKPVA